MTARVLRRALAAVLLAACPALPARAETSNGNDFALYYAEAKTDKERQKLLEQATGRPHYFRYLQIVTLDEDSTAARRAVAITAVEPSSDMYVKFVVTKTVSLEKLREEPKSKVGDAVAVTGVVRGIDNDLSILLGPVVVRHKDRLQPKRGKEMLYEVDPSAVVYSFTGGDRPVHVTHRDRDLLQFRDSVMARSGREGWARFLEAELAKRNAARAAAKKNGEQGQP